MKAREFKLNEALSDQLNVWRLRGYIKRAINPKAKPNSSRFRPLRERRHGLICARRVCLSRRAG